MVDWEEDESCAEEAIEKEILGDELWKLLVRYCPEYKERTTCSWETFQRYLFDEMDEDNLIRFLSAYPDRIDHFLSPSEDDNEAWTLSLSKEGWAKLLEEEAWAADYCEPSILEKIRPQAKWCGADLVDRLMRDCRIAKDCNWSTLSGADWARLLQNNPEYADRCDWAKLSGSDWAALLKFCPQFADRYDWAHLLSDKDWGNLYKRQPQFKRFRRRMLKAAN